jgi:hypothetical protein
MVYSLDSYLLQWGLLGEDEKVWWVWDSDSDSDGFVDDLVGWV